MITAHKRNDEKQNKWREGRGDYKVFMGE